MIKTCPNTDCPTFRKRHAIVKDGSYKRAGDSKKIQRYLCKSCGKRFSSATGALLFKHKHRRITPMIFRMYCSAISQRRMAKILGVSRSTVERKITVLAVRSRRNQARFLKGKTVHHLQIDDLITKENSKLKPLTVSIGVDAESYQILGAKVAQIPAFGHLAKIAQKKYGHRKCHHREVLKALFSVLKDVVDPYAHIRSDKHEKYPDFVNANFPEADYVTYKSERSCVAGQGELKKIKFDPLFAINHACAMMRANINRLVRKTWCTTKVPKRLQDHLDIFVWYFNSELRRNAGLSP
jgi:transposase-like protein